MAQFLLCKVIRVILRGHGKSALLPAYLSLPFPNMAQLLLCMAIKVILRGNGKSALLPAYLSLPSPKHGTAFDLYGDQGDWEVIESQPYYLYTSHCHYPNMAQLLILMAIRVTLRSWKVNPTTCLVLTFHWPTLLHWHQWTLTLTQMHGLMSSDLWLSQCQLSNSHVNSPWKSTTQWVGSVRNLH